MLNLLWGGTESNQVGTAELLDFCRQVNTEPLICVNFESDGRQPYMKAKGSVRSVEIAGEHVQFLALHAMFNPGAKEPVLQGELYRRDPAATWEVLMKAWEISDQEIRRMRESLKGRPFPLAMTECHFAIPGRHCCDVLSTWAAGVSYARILNNHQRHGDLLKVATAADFCGTRWRVNAVMIPTPGGKSYLMPVARIMQLYRHHSGTHALTVQRTPEGLDGNIRWMEGKSLLRQHSSQHLCK